MGGTLADRVTVVLPVVDGEAWIEGAIAAIAAQTLTPIEVLVVDGGSDDGTAAVAVGALARHGLPGRVVHNSARSVASNLNAGLAAATGEIMCRVDVRSRPPRDYLRRVVDALQDPDVAWAGGTVVPVTSTTATQARSVARAHANPVLMGLGRYRLASTSGPAPTVYLGGARCDVLRRAGGWDERLTINEDFDLARRLAADGVVWLDTELAIEWFPPDTLVGAARRLHHYGRGKVRFWRCTGQRPALRQWLMLAAPLLAVATVVGPARRHRRGAASAALLTIAAVGATDALVDRPAPAVERLGGLVVGVIGAAAWWTGVVHELAAGRRSERSARAHDLATAALHGGRVCQTDSPDPAAVP